MRVVIAPDKFAGTLTAVQAAEAIAEGWRRRAAGDELDLAPMSDGGPGFVDVLHAALGGELRVLTVAGPYDEPAPLTVLVVGTTAYVESAQAIGLHLTPAGRRRPERASTRGVGEVIAALVAGGVEQIVVGLGGSATNDGGTGMLGALGATAQGGRLDAGPEGLAGLTAVDLTGPRAVVEGIEIVVASDVESPLLGIAGATKVFGPQKGLPEERLVEIDALLGAWAAATDRKLADAKGAGAAGGLGFGLMLLGARRVPGIEVVAEAIDLRRRLRGADLVITGEGAFDFSSRSGKVPYGVAALSAQALAPCVALAGQVLIGAREMRSFGVESAYSVVELVGERRAWEAPDAALADLAERVARSWSRE